MRRTDALVVAKMMRGLANHHGDNCTITAQHFITHCMGSKKLGNVWVAYIGNTAAGFALTYDCMNFVAGNITRKLDLLYVDKKHRKLGTARALLSAVAQDSIKRKVARMHIEAHDSNGDAQNFYNKLGLTSEIKHRIRYTCGADDLRRLTRNTK